MFHAKNWLIYPENIGPELSIDETSFSNGELYTIITNKAALVAIIKGTKSSEVISVLLKISKEKRDIPEEFDNGV